jgi:hypothetical protein
VSLYRREFRVLQEGDWLEVRGRLSDSQGERWVWVTRLEDLQRGGNGQPLRPQLIRSGEVDEAREGLLREAMRQLHLSARSHHHRGSWPLPRGLQLSGRA